MCLLNVIDHHKYPENRATLESVPGTFVTGIVVWEGYEGALAGLLGVLCAVCVCVCVLCASVRIHTCMHPRPMAANVVFDPHGPPKTNSLLKGERACLVRKCWLSLLRAPVFGGSPGFPSAESSQSAPDHLLFTHMPQSMVPALPRLALGH